MNDLISFAVTEPEQPTEQVTPPTTEEPTGETGNGGTIESNMPNLEFYPHFVHFLYHK
ncbi:hypothetical protein QRY07_12030 [Bacillus cereus]|uniref:hypothetical protein n=1 Tax=Bacillus cereus TaxID=1396 RepID=UPI00256FF688|nr:hypothetical protein [Bacillus cereus]WJE22414.1 hypothetical protein QRY07_12030 [Bacillus cereus]